MNKSQQTAVLFRILDAATAFVLAVVFLNILNSRLLYLIGLDRLQDMFVILFALICVRGLTLLPWRIIRKTPFIRTIAIAALAAGILIAFWIALVGHFADAARAVVETRAAFQSAADRDVMLDVTHDKDVYPQVAFLEKLIVDIPEDAAIVYIGDQFPYILNYSLYPRRVYALPEIQIATLKAHTEYFWTDSSHRDRLHPNPPLWLPSDDEIREIEPDEKIQNRLRELIDDKGVEWVVYYDSYYPENSWYFKLAGQ